METSLKVSKSTVECYKIRSDKNSFWADITIDANGNAGRIQIASDYGDWQYYWGSCGSSFKEFLVKLNLEYVAHKFGESSWFDLDKTVSSLRESIKNYTDDEGELSELNEELENLEESSCKEEYVHKMWDCEKIMKICEGHPSVCASISPRFLSFWDKVWPAFISELKNEISVVA
jgi:hypothetical protein